jgi:hypothetical protein
MPPVEFEHTISVFERAKTVHALDRSATVIGNDRKEILYQNVEFCKQILTSKTEFQIWEITY